MNQARTKIVAIGLIYLLAGAFSVQQAKAAGSLEPDPGVVQTFQEFQHKWMTLLADHGMYGTSYLKLEKDPIHKGAYRASYKKLGEVLNSRVKKTGHKGTPYVGVMTYNEIIYVCSGATPEAAKQGPFERETERTVTEIFRYAKGEWIY